MHFLVGYLYKKYFCYSPDASSLFVFTSSGSVYAENSGGEVDENAAVVRTQRNSKLVDAEKTVLKKVSVYLIEDRADTGVSRNGSLPPLTI